MLVTMKEILAHARDNKYCVPAFDVTEDVMVRTVLETAEELRSPVIIMCLEMHLEGNGWAYLSGLVRAVAEHHDVPVALHLDHSDNLDLIRTAVDYGFTSVMIDGSQLPFEENAELTRAAAEIAHPHGITVEGELGHVGGANLAETDHVESVLTEAEEVVRFNEITNVDALAVSIGTAHGVYRSEPNLNIERLKELNAVSTIPLVLHGGSGTPNNQIREAVKNGICKLNIFADEREAMYIGMKRSMKISIEQGRKDPLPQDMFGPIREELSKTVAEKMRLLSSNGKAWSKGDA